MKRNNAGDCEWRTAVNVCFRWFHIICGRRQRTISRSVHSNNRQARGGVSQSVAALRQTRNSNCDVDFIDWIRRTERAELSEIGWAQHFNGTVRRGTSSRTAAMTTLFVLMWRVEICRFCGDVLQSGGLMWPSFGIAFQSDLSLSLEFLFETNRAHTHTHAVK